MHRRSIAVLGLVLVSGFCALVYEVLWLKELALLFGSTAQAAATTLFIFFLGLALGSVAGGRRMARLRARTGPSGAAAGALRFYGFCEAAIAVGAVTYFVLFDVFRAVYAPLLDAIGHGPGPATLIKLVLATVLLLPAAFFMGCTLPALGEHLVERRDQLGRTGALLYAVNVTGAAAGAFAGGFVLPAQLGFDRSYLLAIALNLVVAVAAIALARGAAGAGAEDDLGPPEPAAPPAPPAGRAVTLPATVLWVVAAASGFLTLALEVLWTRLFSLVVQNSVYTFAAILLVFLLALAIGAVVAHLLARVRRPARALVPLLVASGAAAIASAYLLRWRTEGFQALPLGDGWGPYVFTILAAAAVTMLPTGAVIGAVFPYLLRVAEPRRESAGSTIGRLAAWNTGGAILGSISAGFVIVPWIGAWDGVLAIGGAYALLAIVVAAATDHRTGAAAAAVLLAAAGVAATRPVQLVHLRDQETLVQTWHGAQGVVAVVEVPGNRRITLNNHYSIGGSGIAADEQRQADVPLVLHPAARSAFFLGMGTGITPAAAANHPLERIVVAELVPEIAEAARVHFSTWTRPMFEQPRFEIAIEDGRNWLLAHGRQRFDVIIADLFSPWKAGTGTLYSVEHFATARSRLAEGGTFAQWLPLYQLDRRQFEIIARTMIEVFPRVTLWRGDFYANQPIVMLLGETDPAPLDVDAIQNNVAGLAERKSLQDWERLGPLLLYGGNLTEASSLFAAAPLNTDDRPRIEYLAPVAQIRQRSAQAQWLVGEDLIALYEQVLEAAPLEDDPLLAAAGPPDRALVRAGLELFRVNVYQLQRRVVEADAANERLKALLVEAMRERR